MIKKICLMLGWLILALPGFSQKDKIRINQLGFYPQGPKVAVIVGAKGNRFAIMDEKAKDTLYKGKMKDGGVWSYSEEATKLADFSDFTKEGRFVLVVPGVGKSYPFDISHEVHLSAAKAGLKAFYYNRASTPLKKQHAGKFARAEGHPDNVVLVHPSAATATRPAGTKISSPRGWYDAGDYNKYIVNSGITTYTLLAVYDNFSAYLDTIRVNIPESNNSIPDILDEVLWNLRWMLTMQDEDGGVYHKLTNPNFDAMVMPDQATAERYVVMKSTAAALDFAAVTAAASRILSRFDKALPGLTDSCLKASKAAYAWAKKNPEVYYNQNEMNESFDPDVVTGEYGDGNVSDEFQWAALELFVTTGNKEYYNDANLSNDLSGFKLPNWPQVNTLGLYSLVNNKSRLASAEGINVSGAEKRIIEMADQLMNHAATSAYGISMGIESGDFTWGSNCVNANQSILLIQAFMLTHKAEYLKAAVANFDYLHGRNAVGYCFLTGSGDKSTMHPHHRPSVADGIVEPVPGFLAGGPNPGMQDKQNCTETYPSTLPAKAYLDNDCSYASNEIAINWNAPYVYVAFAVEALMAGNKPAGPKPAPNSNSKEKKAKK